MNHSLAEFINISKPHEVLNSAPPTNSTKRHEWESMMLYSVKDKLKDDVKLIDYGCGEPATLRFNLENRFPKSIYYGLDIIRDKLTKIKDNHYIGNISSLEELSKEADCVVAGSVLSHLDWQKITKLLNKLKPFFENKGEFGFSFFKGNKYALYGPYTDSYHAKVDQIYYHAVEIPFEYFENYCKLNNLKLNLLDFSFDLDHNINYGNKNFNKQSFCNIKK